MSHLDPQRLQALLDSGAPDAALLAHLEAGCEACEAVLAASPLLDDVVDAALLSLVPRPAQSDAPPWRSPAAAAPPSRRRWPVAAAVAAAALLAVVLLPRLLRPPVEVGELGVKGLDAPVTLSLQGALQGADGGFEALADGATVHAGDVLVLRADASRETEGYVLLQRGRGPAEVLEAVRLPAGPQVLERELGLLGISLEGEAGEVTVWVVVGAPPLSREVAAAEVESPSSAPLGRAGLRLHVLP